MIWPSPKEVAATITHKRSHIGHRLSKNVSFSKEFGRGKEEEEESRVFANWLDVNNFLPGGVCFAFPSGWTEREESAHSRKIFHKIFQL
jgi:hypothetical protein